MSERATVPRPRTSWHARANTVVLGYLALAVLTLPLHRALPMPRWLTVHLLLLGGATNAILIWSEHFTVTLLGATPPSRRAAATRLAALNVGVVGVLIGVSTKTSWLTVAAASALALAVLAHVTALLRIARAGRQVRFSGTVHFYPAAGVALVVGTGLGALLAVHPYGWDRREAFHAAHVHANLQGWIALTVLGTLFTLWPMALRTRIADSAMRSAVWCLRLVAVGLGLAVGGLAADQRAVGVIGLVVYAAGVAVGLAPLLAAGRRKPPYDAASWSLAAAAGWLLLGSLADPVLLAGARDMDAYTSRLDRVVPALLVGFTAQVLLGALTYLIPVIVGGGPARVRASMRRMSYAWRLRVAALNLAVPLLARPLPGWARAVSWALAGAPFAAFLGMAASLLVPLLLTSVTADPPSREEPA